MIFNIVFCGFFHCRPSSIRYLVYILFAFFVCLSFVFISFHCFSFRLNEMQLVVTYKRTAAAVRPVNASDALTKTYSIESRKRKVSTSSK